MKKALLLLACAAFAVVLLAARSAQADKAYRDEFVSKYVKVDSDDAKDKAFATAVDQAKCGVCHVGKNKKDRNTYGQALAKLLDRTTDKENKPKIQGALDKVAAMKVDPKDPKSPTFGDLLKSGKLPK